MAIRRNVYVSPCIKLLTVQKRRVSCSFFPFVVLTFALIVVHDSDDLRRHDSNLYMHCKASAGVSEFMLRKVSNSKIAAVSLRFWILGRPGTGGTSTK